MIFTYERYKIRIQQYSTGEESGIFRRREQFNDNSMIVETSVIKIDSL